VLQRSCRFSSSQAEEVFGNGGRELQSAESSGFAGNFNYIAKYPATATAKFTLSFETILETLEHAVVRVVHRCTLGE
jgi:hypothetical protein